MRRRRHRVLAGMAVVLLTAGCLGDDYRDIDLALSDWDHGWLAVVEPEAEMLAASGAFGDDHHVPEGASPQTKLLALLGRHR